MSYEGNDNYGHSKQGYVDKLAAMDDAQLREACDKKLWLSAYADNNPRSDYHWQVDACYDECAKRGKAVIYENAHKAFVASI